MIGWRPPLGLALFVGTALLLVLGCSDDPPTVDANASDEPETAQEASEDSQDRPNTTGDTLPTETLTVTGTVVAATTGLPLPGARVSLGPETVLTTEDGGFEVTVPVAQAWAGDGGLVVIERAAWRQVEVEVPADDHPLDIELEPFTVRGIRVSRDVAADRVRWNELLDLAENSTVNTLVFDTKDEHSTVLYETEVALADELGAVEVVYDPAALIAEANDRGLYTITRIVAFEDALWAAGVPEAKLAGSWVDAGDPTNWRYPIDLALEACQLGFDEVQFDYVRFPSGRTAELAAHLVPPSSEDRAEAIADFLRSARTELEAEGCGISAAVFGIVMTSGTDEGIGQTPETVSAVVDAVSPMLYPSHYSPGWLGFVDPNDHPGPVIAFSLDEGGGRLASGSAMRPWIQGFLYSGGQIKAQIDEAEARGAGWIIWNASGNYRADWLPPSSP